MTIEFATWLAEIALANEKTTGEVLAAWKRYCKDCTNFDQSPVKFEFLQWNGWHELPDPLLEIAQHDALPAGVCKHCGNIGKVGDECDECEPQDGLGPMILQRV